jgi:hypothetical protein
MLDEKPNRATTSNGLKQSQTVERSVGPNLFGSAASARRLSDELGEHIQLLLELAARYNWWQSPEIAVKFPERIVAQVMNLGSFEDTRRMAEELGEDCLRAVLERSEAGQLNARSWHYWHYRLNRAEPDQVPPMPRRRIG